MSKKKNVPDLEKKEIENAKNVGETDVSSGNAEKDEVKTDGKPERKKKSFNKRSFKRGALSIALTVVFIAAVVVLNVIVGIISDRVNTAADLTTEGIYSLDEKTENFLNDSLTSDVTITVLNSEIISISIRTRITPRSSRAKLFPTIILWWSVKKRAGTRSYRLMITSRLIRIICSTMAHML